MSPMMTARDLFYKEIAAEFSHPQKIFDALYALTDEVVGARLFTLMTIDTSLGLASRIYSNQPDAYPVMGTKPIIENNWTKKILIDRDLFVANTIDEIATVFSDYELIQSLGCESVLNIPIVVGGSVVGTLNCLHESGHYSPECILLAEDIKPAGIIAFLIHQFFFQEDEHVK